MKDIVSDKCSELWRRPVKLTQQANFVPFERQPRVIESRGALHVQIYRHRHFLRNVHRARQVDLEGFHVGGNQAFGGDAQLGRQQRLLVHVVIDGNRVKNLQRRFN